MIPRLDALLKGQKISHVIVLAGTNDLGSIEADQIIDNLNVIWGRVREHNAKLLCVTLPGANFVRSHTHSFI